MKKRSDLSTDILIVTYNARKQLARCLRSVMRHTQGVPYQLTILDNASSDDTAEYLETEFCGRLTLIKSRSNLGFSGGVNMLLAQTKLRWVALLDDDVEVTPGWLEKLHAEARRNPDAGIIGGKIVYPGKRIFCAEFSLMPFGASGRDEKDLGQRDYTKEVDALPGPCWLLPRRVIQKVGPFDERFFPCQYEDIDYCLRVRLAGYKIIYCGQLAILHHNLARSGAPGRPAHNAARFFSKWQKTLKRFPLCTQTRVGDLVTEGARIFQKENFFKRTSVIGRQPQLTPWFSESFYRGVAYTAAKENTKAAREFLKVSATLRASRFSEKFLTLNTRYILSVYFYRLGLSNEVFKQVGCIMTPASGNNAWKALDREENFTKELVLHRWRIRISTSDSIYIQTLKYFLPYYQIKNLKLNKGRVSKKVFKISFFNKTNRALEGDFFLKPNLFFCSCPEFGIYHAVDKVKRCVFAAMTRREFIKNSWIFHGAFLWSLLYLLHLERATLVHGALLQKKGSGILILGSKGAGKSTLTTACLVRGYRYFSDEHPILELKSGRVRGVSFVSPIALPATSVTKNFFGLKKNMQWSSDRKKYLVDPEKLWPGSIGTVTSISKVVFPQFRVNATLSVKRMGYRSFVLRLLEDEYLRVTGPGGGRNGGQSLSREIAETLARNTRGYTLEYGPSDISSLPAIFERL